MNIDDSLSSGSFSSDSKLTLGEILADVRPALAARYGDGEVQALLREIMFRLKQYSPTDIAIHSDDHPSAYIEHKIREAAARICYGEPVQYVFGRASFHGLEFEVTPDVLIPRPETSQLVDLIIDRYDGRSDLRIVDLCTGSGCIAISLARALPFADIVGIDISDAALEVARRNAKALRASVYFVRADVLTMPVPDAASLNVVVSNPPYVLDSEAAKMDANVVAHEPPIALFVPDTDPLKFYRPISAYAMAGLKPGGTLWLEINPLCADSLAEMLRADGWESVDTLRDSFGSNRFISCTKPS